MERELLVGMRQVAAVYGVALDAVSVSFDFYERLGEDNGASWRVSVMRASPDRRRKTPDRVEGSGDTFADAIASAIARKPYADKVDGRTAAAR